MRPEWLKTTLSLILLLGIILTGVLSEGMSAAAPRPRPLLGEAGISIASVTPASARVGDTLDVAIVGNGTNFVDGVSVAIFGEGITVNSLVVVDTLNATANITVDPSAAPGPRDVNVITDVEIPAALIGGFVITGPPVITGVAPAIGIQGRTMDVAIEGSYTNFVDGVSVANFGGGIAVNSLTVADATHATANISIDPSAAPGPRDVNVITGSEEPKALAAGFTVLEIRIESVSPVSGVQGDTLKVDIVGNNTGFVQGVSQADFGAGITVNSTTVLDATHATADITISMDAARGPRDVNVITGLEMPVALASAFTVLPKAVIVSVSPLSGYAGDTVTITGRGFLDTRDTSYVSFGSVKVTDYVSWSDTQIVCKVPAWAVPGNVTVTTFTGTSNGVYFKVLNTRVGRKVVVNVSPTLTLVFDRVLTEGTTLGTPGATPTINKKLSAVPGSDVALSTDARFSGNVTLYFTYSIKRVPRREHVYVMHLEKGRWFNRTINQNAKKPVVVGRARSLGEFVLAIKAKKTPPGQQKKATSASTNSKK